MKEKIRIARERVRKMNKMKKEIADYIFENIGWDGMEVAIYEDGDYGLRQIGSFGESEDLMIAKINVSEHYWNYTMIAWFGEDWKDKELDQEVVKEFIKAEIINIYLYELK